MWPAEKRQFTQSGFAKYVDSIYWHRWRPSRIVLHNTAAPSLAQWIASADADERANRIRGITRITNLERYFRDDNHWSGCPHLFIANDYIWVMNPLAFPGVHSPSFNSTALGIEMIGDYAREDDESGAGLAVKQNTIFACAALCSALGLDATEGVTDKSRRRIVSGTIFLHKQDWATTHDCPGEDVAMDHAQIVAEVAGLMEGGEHSAEDVGKVIAGGSPSTPPAPTAYVRTTVGGLNLRKGPGAMNVSLGQLPLNLELAVLSQAANGQTVWLKVRTPAGVVGWVSGYYTKESGK